MIKGPNYTASELANCSGACHVYSDTTQSTITRSLPDRIIESRMRRPSLKRWLYRLVLMLLAARAGVRGAFAQRPSAARRAW